MAGPITIRDDFRNLIPPLADDELAQLEANIVAQGCRDALVVWQERAVLLDGHNRHAICQKHGIAFAVVEISLADDDAAAMWIIDNQQGRRNLSKIDRIDLARRKEEILRRQAKERSGTRTDLGAKLPPGSGKTRQHAAKEAGVGERTYDAGKAILVAVEKGQIKPTVVQEIREGKKSIHGVAKDIQKAEKKAQRETARAALAQTAATIKPDERWHVYHGDIATWQAPRQYDFIITDPPYPKEYLPLWSTLACRAVEWLKPGGLLIAMSGQSYLDEIYAMLGEHLTYYWTAAYLTPGQPTPLRQINVNTTWKPLLIYRKEQYTGKIFGDVFKSDANEKDHHKWGQSVSGMCDIVSKMCLPGQYILDPFCGAGTTGIAAIKHGCLFDGLEIEAENVKIATARIGNEQT